MSKITPFLCLYNALEAIDYYQDIFDAKLINITMLDTFEGFEEYPDKVAHSSLLIGDSYLFINDNLKDDPLPLGDHIFFSIEFESKDKVISIFNELAKEGHVFVPLSDVSWSEYSGTVRDKYHVTWMLNVA